MVNVPGPAVIGLKELPVTAVPLKVPPAGVPDRVIFELPAHTFVNGFMLTEGAPGGEPTDAVLILVHPELIVLISKLWVPGASPDTGVVKAPNVPPSTLSSTWAGSNPPNKDKATDPLLFGAIHAVGLVTVVEKLGIAFTVTTVVAVAVQPLELVTVTV